MVVRSPDGRKPIRKYLSNAAASPCAPATGLLSPPIHWFPRSLRLRREKYFHRLRDKALAVAAEVVRPSRQGPFAHSPARRSLPPARVEGRLVRCPLTAEKTVRAVVGRSISWSRS